MNIQVYNLVESGILTVDVPKEHHGIFRELVFRATNLWPDAPPEIKHFADIICHGKPLQAYAEQARDLHANRTLYTHLHQCSCGHVNTVKSFDPTVPKYSITCENKILVDIKGKNNPEDLKHIPCKRTEKFKQY